MADRNFAVNMVIGARDRASKAVRGLSGALGKLNNRVTQVGTALATYFGVQAISRFFSGAVSSAADFEQAIDRIGAVTGATGEELDKLRAAAEEMGATTQFTATEAANGLEILGRAGLDATESVETLPSVLQLAQASGMQLAEAAGVVTDSLGAMGQGVQEAGRFADILAQGARLANTDVQKLGQALSQAGVQAAQMGLSAEETVGVLDALANAGIRGERAGTALRNILSQLQDPSSTAREEMAKLGIETSDLTEAIGQLNQAGPQAQAAVLAFGREAGPALRTLLEQGRGGLAEYTEALNNADGAAREMADEATDNLQGALDGLASAWDALRRELVDPLIEPITRQVRNLSAEFRELAKGDALKSIQKALVSAFKTATKTVQAFVREAGGIPGVLDKAQGAIQSFTSGMDRLGKSVRVVTGGVKVAFNAVTILFEGTASTITGAVNLVAQGVERMTRVAAQVVPGMEGILGKVEEVARATSEAYDESARRVREDLQDIQDGLRDVMEGFERTADAGERSGERMSDSADTAAGSVDNLRQSMRDLNAAMDPTSIDALADRHRELGEEVTQLASLQYTLVDSNDALAAKYRDLGLSLDNAGKRFSVVKTATRESGEDAEATAAQFDRLTGAISETADSRGLVELRTKIRGMFLEGKIGAEELDTALEKIRTRFDEIGNTANEQIDSMADFQSALAGADTVKELDALERTLRDAWESGRISAEQYNRALEQIHEKQKQIADDTKTHNDRMAESWGKVTRSIRVGITFADKFWRLMGRSKADSAAVSKAFNQQRDAIEGMQRAIQDSSGSMADLARIANFNVEQFDLVGNQTLDPLRNAIRQARRQLQQLNDAADSTLDSVNADLLQLQGRYADLERQRIQARREDIQAQLSQAEAAGSTEAVNDLRDALQKLEQIERIRVEKAEKQEQQERQQSAPTERTGQRDSGIPTPRQTHRIELALPGGEDASLTVPEDESEQLLEALQRAGLRSSTPGGNA